jgi:hypothetical protein
MPELVRVQAVGTGTQRAPVQASAVGTGTAMVQAQVQAQVQVLSAARRYEARVSARTSAFRQ